MKISNIFGSLLLIGSGVFFAAKVNAGFVQKIIPVENYAIAHVKVISDHPMSAAEVSSDGDIRYAAYRFCARKAWEYHNKLGQPLVPKNVRGRYTFVQNEFPHTPDSPEFSHFTQSPLENGCKSIVDTYWECNGHWELNGGSTHPGHHSPRGA